MICVNVCVLGTVFWITQSFETQVREHVPKKLADSNDPKILKMQPFSVIYQGDKPIDVCIILKVVRAIKKPDDVVISQTRKESKFSTIRGAADDDDDDDEAAGAEVGLDMKQEPAESEPEPLSAQIRLRVQTEKQIDLLSGGVSLKDISSQVDVLNLAGNTADREFEEAGSSSWKDATEELKLMMTINPNESYFLTPQINFHSQKLPEDYQTLDFSLAFYTMENCKVIDENKAYDMQMKELDEMSDDDSDDDDEDNEDNEDNLDQHDDTATEGEGIELATLSSLKSENDNDNDAANNV